MNSHSGKSSRKIFQLSASRAKEMKGTSIVAAYYPRIVLCVCFSIAILVALSSTYSAQADSAHAVSMAEAGRQLLQDNSPLSPIAMTDQGVSGAAVEDVSVAGQSTANQSVVGVFHEANADALPLIAGTQANQTSLILVGAVLVSLVLVVGLAISRKGA